MKSDIDMKYEKKEHKFVEILISSEREIGRTKKKCVALW